MLRLKSISAGVIRIVKNSIMRKIKSNFFNVRWNQDKLNGMKKEYI